jgi:hypothetical protein
MDTTSKRPTTTTPHPRKKKVSSSSHWSQHYERMYKNVTYTLIQPPSNIPPGTPHRYFHSSFRVDHYGSDEPQTTTTVNINNNYNNSSSSNNNNRNSDSDASFGTDRSVPDKPREVYYSHIIHQHVNGLLIVTAATPPPPPLPPLTSFSAASIVMSHKNISCHAIQWVLPSMSVTTSINGTKPSHVTDHDTNNDDTQQRAVAILTKDSHTAIERQSKLTLPLSNNSDPDNFQASISTPSRATPSDDTLTQPSPVLQRIAVLPDSVLAIGIYVTDDTIDAQQHQQQAQKQQKHQQPFLCGVWGTLIDWNQNLSPQLINDDALMDGFLAIVQPIGPFPPTKFRKYGSVCQPDF